MVGTCQGSALDDRYPGKLWESIKWCNTMIVGKMCVCSIGAGMRSNSDGKLRN